MSARVPAGSGVNELLAAEGRASTLLNIGLEDQFIQHGTRDEVLHQAGGATLDIARGAYAEAGVEAEITPFIDDMASAYEKAGLVLCRAGATSIAELTVCGRPAILVPFPFAVDDHQTRNAEVLTAAGAAILLQGQGLDYLRCSR